MSKTKVIVDLTDYKGADLTPVARHIANRMTANAALFDAPPVPMPVFGTLVDTYEARLIARAGRGTAVILALQQTRGELKARLADLGHYINAVAKGDAGICEKSGFPTYTTGRCPDPSPPAAPSNLRLKYAGFEGGIIARYQSPRRTGANEIQTTTADPNDEASWTRYGIFHGNKAILTGLTPGLLLWVLVRTVGL